MIGEYLKEDIRSGKTGQQLWFRTDEREPGQTRSNWVARQGTVTGITKTGRLSDTVTLECDGRMFEVNSSHCYVRKSEMDSDIKWDKCQDEFMEKLAGAADGFTKKLMGVTGGVVKSSVENALPDGAADAAKGMGHAMQLYGFQFRQKVSTLTERFLGRTQDMCLTQLSDNLKERALHTDLSEYEPGKVFLEDRDLRGLSQNAGKGMAL